MSVQNNRWLLGLGITGFLYLLIAPYLINIDDYVFSIMFPYGAYFGIYQEGSLVQYVSMAANDFAPNNLFIVVSPACSFLGIFLILLGGIYHTKDRFSKMKRYILLTFFGAIIGFTGVMLFIPFGLNIQANLYNFTSNPSIDFNWQFFGIYPAAILFFGLGLWSTFRLIHPPSNPTDDSAFRLSALSTHRQNINQIQQSFDSIPLQMLRRMLNINSQKDLENLRKLLPPEMQYSIVGTDAIFLKETISTIIDPATLIRATRKDICYFCGESITLDDKNCPSCHRAKLNCTICKLPIKNTDEIGQCPHCGSMSHLKHLKTWIEIRMKCPYCLHYLTPNEYKVITRNDLLQNSLESPEITSQ
ncbi:MAG: hypothetical protein JXA54_07000 [Candidatus Heimdallarchaeota archaeon]|nr:hypothetical protein [Candidatus Heimdallarchaeota archaeon]